MPSNTVPAESRSASNPIPKRATRCPLPTTDRLCRRVLIQPIAKDWECESSGPLSNRSVANCGSAETTATGARDLRCCSLECLREVDDDESDRMNAGASHSCVARYLTSF